MSDTNSNAYRLEAAEKRRQAELLSAEAKALTEQADEIEKTQNTVPVNPETELPQGGETYTPEAEKEDKPSKIPFKKS